MSKLKRLSLWAGFFLGVATAVLICRPRPEDPVFFRDSLCKLREGMSLTEVERIMGCPQGDYSTGAIRGAFQITSTRSVVDNKLAVWRGNDGFAMIGFDERGRVASVGLRTVSFASE